MQQSKPHIKVQEKRPDNVSYMVQLQEDSSTDKTRLPVPSALTTWQPSIS